MRYVLFSLLLFGCPDEPTKPSASPIMKSAESLTNEIYAKVKADEVEKYAIAKRAGGSKTDLCFQAMTTAAAHLQAKDEAGYATWKKTQAEDCKAAGVPVP